MSEADGSLARLLVVQDLDTSITQLQHRRAALPEKSGLTALRAELAALDVERAATQAQCDVLVATQKDLESQIAAVTERRTGIEQRMYAARGSSTRDLQAMDEEVRHLAEKTAELEELELVAMVEQEPFDATLAALAERRAPLETKAVDLGAEVGQAEVEIDAELATATAERATQAAELPAALAERYEALRTRLRGTGAARLIDHHCGGCHLEMAQSEVEKIRRMPPDTMVTCDQCGRILIPV